MRLLLELKEPMQVEPLAPDWRRAGTVEVFTVVAMMLMMMH